MPNFTKYVPMQISTVCCSHTWRHTLDITHSTSYIQTYPRDSFNLCFFLFKKFLTRLILCDLKIHSSPEVSNIQYCWSIITNNKECSSPKCFFLNKCSFLFLHSNKEKLSDCSILNCILLSWHKNVVKGIVSRDWGELPMIPMDKSEVFSIAGSYLYSFNNVFMFKCLKNKRLRYGIWLSVSLLIWEVW